MELVYNATIKAPDRKKWYSPKIISCWEGEYPISSTHTANIRLWFDEDTGKLLRAEVIK